MRYVPHLEALSFVLSSWFASRPSLADPNCFLLVPIHQANFKTWNDALKQKDFDKVAALYSSTELSFLPTASPKFIRDGHSTKEYFIEFLKRIPDGTITADSVQRHGDDAYLHTGLYTFMMGPPEDRRPVEARFSYMWRRFDGQWRITHHHSSALPSPPPPAPSPASTHPAPAVERVGGRVRGQEPAPPSINDPAFVESLTRRWAGLGKP
jgi:uncharacterized protein (TIGR02246 family)